MPLKIHILNLCLGVFCDNLDAIINEQGEMFHRDISVMEQQYQGRWDSAVVGEYCGDKTVHKRKS